MDQETDFNAAEYGKVMEKYWRAQARHEYWFGLFNVLRQWARFEDDYSLSWLQRIFYTCKAILCMVLRRQQSYFARNNITVAIFDNEPCGGLSPSWATSWHQVVVGVGLLKGWYYDIYYDSSE